MAEIAMTTLERVGVKRKSLEGYRCIVGDELIDEIRLVAAQLKETYFGSCDHGRNILSI